MPKKRPQFLEYFLSDCVEYPELYKARAMFGGYGIYKGGNIFAIYTGEEKLYFKVGENNRKDYEEKGMKPFEYTKKGGKVGVMSYYELPEEIIENREKLEIWIEKSLAVVSKIKKKKKTQKNLQLDQKILEYLQTIPKGKVSTYKNIAQKFGVHPRRVAMTMKQNKYPDTYSCYKVISHSGKIGGYNTHRGVIEKIERLKLDGIQVVDGKIEKKYII